MSESRKIGVYLATVFALAYTGEFFVLSHGGIEGPAMGALAPVIMWVPGVTALVLSAASGGGIRRIAWRLPRPVFLAWGILLPSVGAAVAFLAITASGLGRSPDLPRIGTLVSVAHGTFVLGRGEQSLPFFLVNFLATAVALSLAASVLTAGEEIGWRGWLQPRLVGRFGKAGGLALLGLVWAHWHTPLVLHGFNYPEFPRLGAWVLWPLMCISISFVFGWLTINGGSIWPSVLAHACLNAIYGGLVLGILYPTPRAHLEGDLISLAVWAAAGGACLAATKPPPDLESGSRSVPSAA